MPGIRVELDRHRIDGRTAFFRHIGKGLFQRLLQAQKISENEVLLPDNSFEEAAKAYYLLSDPYKTLAGIPWTDDIKKAALSMASVMVVSPFQVPAGMPITNRYIPHINGLFAEAAACSILDNEEFSGRHFESKLHFYNSLLLFGKFDGLSDFIADLPGQGTRDAYEIKLSVQDRSKISSAIQTSEMIFNFKVAARAPAGQLQPHVSASSAVSPKRS